MPCNGLPHDPWTWLPAFFPVSTTQDLSVRSTQAHQAAHDATQAAKELTSELETKAREAAEEVAEFVEGHKDLKPPRDN